jgi:hypothetical protein
MNVHDSSRAQEAIPGRMSPVQHSHTDAASAELHTLTIQLERASAIEAEFRAFADSGRYYAFITLGLDNTVIGWNRGAELLLGLLSRNAGPTGSATLHG